jgi:hypothetical protein
MPWALLLHPQQLLKQQTRRYLAASRAKLPRGKDSCTPSASGSEQTNKMLIGVVMFLQEG